MNQILTGKTVYMQCLISHSFQYEGKQVIPDIDKCNIWKLHGINLNQNDATVTLDIVSHTKKSSNRSLLISKS